MTSIKMHPHNPLVSVVLTTYNYAPYLPYSINSVLTQTYQNFELIIIDDGSTDNTPRVVKPYLKDSRIKYYRKNNGGQASAKNLGIDKSRGSYIAFLDADDVWDKLKLEKQMPLFHSNERIGIVYSRRQLIDPTGKESPFNHPQLFRGNVFHDIIVNNFVCFSSAIIRKECIETCGKFDETLLMAIDYDLWIRIAKNYLFEFIDVPLVKYRIGHGQMSENMTLRIACIWKVMEKCFNDSDYVGEIPLSVKLYAKSHTYGNMAFYYQSRDQRAKSLKFYLKSLFNNPFYFFAIKGIIKCFLPNKISSLLKRSRS